MFIVAKDRYYREGKTHRVYFRSQTNFGTHWRTKPEDAQQLTRDKADSIAARLKAIVLEAPVASIDTETTPSEAAQ